MLRVACRYLSVGPNRRRNLTPAPRLPGESPRLCRTFRRELLNRPRGFNSQIDMEGLAPIQFRWEPVGQTAGTLIFPPFVQRRDQQNPDIIVLLLNGVESPEDLSALSGKFAIPDAIWRQVLDAERPIAFTFVFQAGRLRDPATITVLSAFANSFFSLFGTNEVEEPLLGS